MLFKRLIIFTSLLAAVCVLASCGVSNAPEESGGVSEASSKALSETPSEASSEAPAEYVCEPADFETVTMDRLLVGRYAQQNEKPDTLFIKAYKGGDSYITVPAEIDGKAVKGICSDAFEGLSLKGVKLSDGIAYIGAVSEDKRELQGFLGCTTAEAVELPEGFAVTTFRYCDRLTEINMPQSWTDSAIDMFMGCSSLVKVALPAGLTRIEKNMFSMCTSLSDITIPDGVTSIGTGAFAGCAFTELRLPDSVEAIGTGSFPDGCTLILSKNSKAVEACEAEGYKYRTE